MIARLFSPSRPSRPFPTGELPEAIHGLALQNTLVPIVNSESMVPTLQKGDGLELEDANNLRVGDVVLYRNDRLFICHRIHRIENHRLFLRGDASSGPFEEVDVQQVVGRVRFLFRQGQRIAVSHQTSPAIAPASPGGGSRSSRLNVARLGRLLALQLINWFTGLPILREIARAILRKLMTIEMMERAPLHSLEGYIVRQCVRLNHQAVQPSLAPLNSDGIVLIVRAGPIYLGACRLNPLCMEMRPLLRSLTSQLLWEFLRLFPPSYIPPHSSQH